MSSTLSTYTINRDNNFNLIRFLAAFLVLLSHSYAIAIGREAEPLRQMIGISWGGIAVDIFFITSGFLITSSYFNRNNIFHFAWARILRIYPALFVAVLFCVFIIGLGFTTISAWEYVKNEQTHDFLIKNVILFFGVKFGLPGVFADNPVKYLVNGSLWTLPIEIKMYVYLGAVLFLLNKLRKKYTFVSLKLFVLLIAIASVIVNIINHFFPFLAFNINLFSMFFVGSTYFIWRESIPLSSNIFIFIFAALVASLLYTEIFFIVYIFALPYMILYLAYIPTGIVRKFNNVGDYSYGLYIYAFPVQQSIRALIPDIDVATIIILSFCITFILALLSWHLIEKQFMKKKELTCPKI